MASSFVRHAAGGGAPLRRRSVPDLRGCTPVRPLAPGASSAGWALIVPCAVFRNTEAGTRAGLHGQVLVSTGLADLDQHLNGGLPLGTVLLVMEDAFSPHATTFLKYFLAEGVACSQPSMWLSCKHHDPLPQLARAHAHSQVVRALYW